MESVFAIEAVFSIPARQVLAVAGEVKTGTICPGMTLRLPGSPDARVVTSIERATTDLGVRVVLTIALDPTDDLPHLQQVLPGTRLSVSRPKALTNRVFISWYDGDRDEIARKFMLQLQALDLACEHSPSSPQTGVADPRWTQWYSRGLPQAVAAAEAFVAVISQAYDSSTWMAIEFDTAFKSYNSSGRPLLFYVRSTRQPIAKGFHRYLESAIELPGDPHAAAQRLAHLLRR